ncbi:tetratricopeptide repeat protein [candidate division WOR-3 bacterium]|nr:tetratricopeptide repeat protein [candidate division WOR-3 bacterium]
MSSLFILLAIWPGGTYAPRGNLAEAYRYFMLESAIDPSHSSYYHAAVCALAQGDYEGAYELLLKVDHSLPHVHYYLGIVFYQRSLIDVARAHFTRAIEEDPELWQARYYMGLIELKQNRIDEASWFLRDTPDTIDRSMILPYIDDYEKLLNARIFYTDGDYQHAIDTYDAVQHYFGYREIGLAHAYSRLQEYDQCLSLLDTVIVLSRQQDLVTHSLAFAADVSIIMKNIGRARHYLYNLMSIDPGDRTRYLLGRTYSDEVLYDSAHVYFNRLPDSVDEYLFFKARTEYFLGLWGRAEEKLLRHREQFPESPFGDRAIFILASINYKREEYAHAIDFFTELCNTYPASIYAATAQRTIGTAYYGLGEYENALTAYERVKDFNPPRNIEEETTLCIYETQYKLGKYRTLIDALRSFISHDQSSRLVPKTRMRIAKLLLEQKEYYQSISELNQISELYPDQAIAFEADLEKARIYDHLGNKREQKRTLLRLFDQPGAEEYQSYVANELAAIYSEVMDYDSSLHYYNILLAEEQYREKAVFEIARIYDLLGQYDEAETMVDQLISDYPTSVFLFHAYLIKVHVYKNSGEYDKAVELLTDLTTKLGKRPEIYMELGNLHVEMEQYVRARDNYLTAGEYYKQNRDGAAQAWLSAGDASVAIEDYKRARELFLQAHLIAESIMLKDMATARLSAISEE